MEADAPRCHRAGTLVSLKVSLTSRVVLSLKLPSSLYSYPPSSLRTCVSVSRGTPPPGASHAPDLVPRLTEKQFIASSPSGCRIRDLCEPGASLEHQILDSASDLRSDSCIKAKAWFCLHRSALCVPLVRLAHPVPLPLVSLSSF